MGLMTDVLERRASWAPSDDRWYSWLQRESIAGLTVTPETAMQYGVVYRCVKLMASTVATLPLHVYRHVGKSKERASGHPLYRLLHLQPNPEMTAKSYWEAVGQHLQLWGNHYSEKEFDLAGRLIGLWPLQPSNMVVRRPGLGAPLEYHYMLPGTAGRKVLAPRQVFHVRGLSSTGITGYSVVTLARESIGLGLAAEEYLARFYANDATPRGALEVPSELDDPAYDRMREGWEKAYGGLSKSHRTAILEQGTTYKAIGMPMADAEFLATRKFQVTEMCRWFGLSPHLVMDLERATYSNIEHQGLEFVIYALREVLVMLEQQMRVSLFDPGDEAFPEFVVEGLLRGDSKARWDNYTRAIMNGAMSINEVRALENMNPIPYGDTHLVPLNMIPLETIISEPALPPGTSAGRQVAEGRVPSAKTVAVRKRIMQTHRRLIRDAAGRVVRREVKEVRRAARKALRDRAAVDFQLWLEEFYRGLPADVARLMLPALTTYGELIADAAAGEAGGEPPGLTPELEAFLRGYSDVYGRRHAHSSLNQMRQLVRDAGGLEEMLAAIEGRLEEWEEKRPEKIAMNESVEASNAVAKQVFLGLRVRSLVWLATGAKPCEYCLAMSGVVIGIQEVFFDGGVDFAPEGAQPMAITQPTFYPPLHGGCECIITAV